MRRDASVSGRCLVLWAAFALLPSQVLAGEAGNPVPNAPKEFAGGRDAADAVVASLADPDPKVQDQALRALERSPKPPPLPPLREAFRAAKGKAALRLLALLFEQEDAALPAALVSGFADRSPEERLAILTAVAGHADASTLDLAKLGLRDGDAAVQRAALMRLLAFPKDAVLPLVEDYARTAGAGMAGVADAVRRELSERRLFPFLREAPTARETVFPSRHGTVPMVSPDGQWVAYVETGWGRSGMDKPKLLSLVHAVQADGTDDRIISDMFLVGWLADSRRIGSARDAHAAVCDLDGNVLNEFGEPTGLEGQQFADGWARWRKEDPRSQAGGAMPHRKYLAGLFEYNSGEGGALSPDGRQYGPLAGTDGVWLVDGEGHRTPIAIPEEPFQPPWKSDVSADGSWELRSRVQVSVPQSLAHGQAIWSPDGRHIALTAGGHAPLVLAAPLWQSTLIEGADPLPAHAEHGCRWNPWSKDGSRLAFLKRGQVWTAAPDGTNARQLTFDGGAKASPTFARDGKLVAFVVWGLDARRPYSRPSPTDVWVVDVETTLAVRATAPSPGRIFCLDWLNEHEVIFDRLEPGFGPKASLRRLDLSTPAPKVQ